MVVLAARSGDLRDWLDEPAAVSSGTSSMESVGDHFAYVNVLFWFAGHRFLGIAPGL